MTSFTDLPLPGMLVKMGHKMKVIQIKSGSHGGLNSGVCVMEAVSALWPGQSHTDHPTCVRDEILSLGIGINDKFESDANRQILWKFIPKFMGTDKDGLNEDRAKVGLAWLLENGVTIESIKYNNSSFNPEKPELRIVCNQMSSVFAKQPEGPSRIATCDAMLSALMPHEPPSLAKLQWENLQATKGKDVDPSQIDVAAYANAGLAVAI